MVVHNEGSLESTNDETLYSYICKKKKTLKIHCHNTLSMNLKLKFEKITYFDDK